MPRRCDPETEERILDAAQTLWQKGGEEVLTMRAIARIAGTNPPTVYRRFKNRHDIVRALLRRVERDLAKALDGSGSPEEICVRYIDFASKRPCEYRLLELHANELSQASRPRGRSTVWNSAPIGNLIRKHLAERLGGSVTGHERLSFALWSLAHGTASLLISKGVSIKHCRELRAAFDAELDTLICSSTLSKSDLWVR
jgi:AcrR family transcriptional regulator